MKKKKKNRNVRDFALIRCSLATIDLNCNRTPYKRIILFLQAALLIAMANTIRAVDGYADVGAVAVAITATEMMAMKEKWQ